MSPLEASAFQHAPLQAWRILTSRFMYVLKLNPRSWRGGGGEDDTRQFLGQLLYFSRCRLSKGRIIE